MPVSVKPEPPEVLYVTETSDGQLTATALPPTSQPESATATSTSPTPNVAALPPLPSLAPRPVPPSQPIATVTPTMPRLTNGHSSTAGQASPPASQGSPTMPVSDRTANSPNTASVESTEKPTSPVGSSTSNTIMASAPKQTSDKNSEDPDHDSASRKGIFGWTTVNSENLPVLFRNEEKYVAVRMVENKLLSHFPNMFPEELKDRPPLHSFYASEHEVKLLNEINSDHCDYEFGHEPFCTKDLVVKLSEFKEFFAVVLKSFPEDVLQNMKFDPNRIVRGGWVQINNTVVPYIYRDKTRYVPLKVIKYAATLLISPSITGWDAKPEECDYLNKICNGAGISFNFDEKTSLVGLDLISLMCKPVLTELPSKKPFENAKFVEIPPPQPQPPQQPLNAMSSMTTNLPFQGVPPRGPYPPGGPYQPGMPLPPGMPPPYMRGRGPESAMPGAMPPVTAAENSQMPGTAAQRPMPGHPWSMPPHPGMYQPRGYIPPNSMMDQRFPVMGPGYPYPSMMDPNAPPVTNGQTTGAQGTIPGMPGGPRPYGNVPYMNRIPGPPPYPGMDRSVPPYMYPGHMMPPQRMRYQYPLEKNVNQELSSLVQRRRSNESQSSTPKPPSRGSTPGVITPDPRRHSSGGDAPSVPSRPSSVDSTRIMSPASAHESQSPRSTTTPVSNLPDIRTSQGPNVTMQTAGVRYVSSEQSRMPGPQNPLPILNVPNFMPGVNTNQLQQPPNVPLQPGQPPPNVSLQPVQRQVYPGYIPRPQFPMNPNQPPPHYPQPHPMQMENPPVVSIGLACPLQIEKHFGVTLPIVRREDTLYSSVKHVANECFPKLDTNKLLYALEKVLEAPLCECNPCEERAFMTYPTGKNLQVTKLISVKHLEEFLPPLKYMFKDFVNPVIVEYFDQLLLKELELEEGKDGKTDNQRSGEKPEAIVIGSDDEEGDEGKMAEQKKDEMSKTDSAQTSPVPSPKEENENCKNLDKDKSRENGSDQSIPNSAPTQNLNAEMAETTEENVPMETDVVERTRANAGSAVEEKCSVSGSPNAETDCRNLSSPCVIASVESLASDTHKIALNDSGTTPEFAKSSDNISQNVAESETPNDKNSDLSISNEPMDKSQIEESNDSSAETVQSKPESLDDSVIVLNDQKSEGLDEIDSKVVETNDKPQDDSVIIVSDEESSPKSVKDKCEPCESAQIEKIEKPDLHESDKESVASSTCVERGSPVDDVVLNNQSFLKIVSVVGNSDMSDAVEKSWATEPSPNTSPTISSSEKAEPKLKKSHRDSNSNIFSTFSNNILSIKSENSDKVSDIGERRTSLKRKTEDDTELVSPAKRFLVEDKSQKRRSSSDETVILQHNMKDGSVKEVVCID